MVKDLVDTHDFKYPWNQTVEAAIHKYPNPKTPNVKYTDVVSRKIDGEGNLVSEKLLGVTFVPNRVLRYALKILGEEYSNIQYSLENSQLDLVKKAFTLRSLNKTYANCVSLYETLKYIPTSNNPATTTLIQTTTCDMYVDKYHMSFRWALRKGEGAFIDKCEENAPKGRLGVDHVVKSLQEEWLLLEKEAIKGAIGCMKSVQGIVKDSIEKAERLERYAQTSVEGVVKDSITSMEKAAGKAAEIAAEKAVMAEEISREMAQQAEKVAEELISKKSTRPKN